LLRVVAALLSYGARWSSGAARLETRGHPFFGPPICAILTAIGAIGHGAQAT